ncbi:MAG: hypothetical protein AAFV53_35965 [Myxococcota bacterium]
MPRSDADALVQAVQASWSDAPVSPPVRAALGLIVEMAERPAGLSAHHFAPLRDAGVPEAAIAEVIEICAAFLIISRVADAMGFDIQTPENFRTSARILLMRGY